MKSMDWSLLGLGVPMVIAAAATLGACDKQVQIDGEGTVVTVQDDRSRSCRSLAGESRSRVVACLGQLGSPQLSQPATAELMRLGQEKKILRTGAPLPLGDAVKQVSLAGEAELLELALGTDEKALARAVRDADIRGLFVHRDLDGAMDRDSVVLSRLAHHDHLEWFELKYATEEGFIYGVRSSPGYITEKTGDQMLKGLRARLAGEQPVPVSWQPSSISMIGLFRLQGDRLAIRWESGSNMERSLDDLAAKLRREWERDVQILGLGSLEDNLDGMRLELHVITERAPLEPRSQASLFEIMEMGIDGAVYRTNVPGDTRFAYMPGSELTTHSWKSVDKMLREMVKLHGWRSERPWEVDGTTLDLIRTSHFLESKRGGGEAVRLVRGLPEVTLDDVTDEAMRQMLIDGGEWWLRNEQPDGRYNYKYWPTQNRMSDNYNEVRHILATRDLADTWRYRKDDRYLQGARRGMDWLLQYQVHHGDPVDPKWPHPPENTMLFRVANNQKLGTVAVALLGWVEWAKATGSHEQDENIREMAAFVLSQLETNGKFDPYYVNAEHSYYGQKNDIVPGEAALALGEVAEYFDELKWVEFFPTYIDFYEPWFEARAIRKVPTGRWPHDTYTNADRLDLVQFGPWSVMAARQYYELTKDKRAAEFGLKVADWMIDNYQWRTDRTPFPDYAGGYYKMPWELPAMQTFCYSEGTAAAYRLAALYDPSRKAKYELSTREALRFLQVMQYDELDSYYMAEDELIHGGIKYAMNENKIRIDYVGHGLSTVSQFLDAREIDPDVQLELTPLDLSAPANGVRARERAVVLGSREEAAEGAEAASEDEGGE